MTTTMPALDGGLSTRAMLCGLSISLFGNRRMDKTMSEEAAKTRGMGKKVGRYNRWLLIEDKEGNECAEYKAIVSARNKAEVVHREMTLPWMDNGTRINSARNFFEWSAAIKEQKLKFDEAVANFCDHYYHLVDRTKLIMDLAAQEQGTPSMFDGRKYPSLAYVRSRFSFEVAVDPLPTSEDFRVKLSDNQVESIKESIENRTNRRIQDATEHLFERLGDVVKRVVTLGDPKTPLTQALVRDIASVTSIARRLNIAGDGYLDAFADRIVKELSFDTFHLKTDAGERDALAKRANRLLSDMAGFMSAGEEL